MCAFPVYTAQAPGYSAGNCLRQALGCVHFPGLSRSGSGSRVLSKGADSVGPVPFPGPSSSGDHALGECTLLRWAVCLIASPVPATRFPWCTRVTPSQVCRMSLLGSWSLAATLPVDVNRPESQELLISNGACLQFARGYLSGAAIAPFWLWLCLPTPPPTPPTACLSSVGNWGGPQPTGSPQSFVLWAGLAVPQVRAFCRIVFSLSPFFFSLSLWLSHSLDCYLTLAPSDCFRALQLVLTLSNAAGASLFSPCLLVVSASAGSCCLARNLWALFIYPPGYVTLWDSKIPHKPAGESVSWCLETSLLTLRSQDGSPSLPLLSLFLSFIFALPPFEDNGLPSWVPDVLCQYSEVVLWNLLSVQMFFQWICRGESGLPILFLCHLRTTPL